MSNKLSEKTINFRVYDSDGKALLGLADAELPNFESLTETIQGAGIAGEVDSPTLGHFGSMVLSLNWRMVEKDALRLMAPMAHQLELRGSVQIQNASTGQLETIPLKVVVRAMPKSTGLGSLKPGSPMEPSWEGEVTYIKVFLDGRVYAEIDKYNFICVIDGTDYLESVRSDLGI